MEKFKQFLQDTSAVSYGYLIIAAFLILGSAIWLLLTKVFNQLFIGYNKNVVDGMVTVQNQNAMQFHANIIYIVPIVLLIGLFAWGIIRALERRNEA